MSILKIDNQATEFQINSATFVAVDDDSGLCSKCAFLSSAICAIAPYCTPTLRNDGRSIVWIEKQKEN